MAPTVRVAKSSPVRIKAVNGSAKPREPKDEHNAYIPPKEVADAYVHRQVNGVDDFRILEYAQENSMNILLRGDTGSGKTHCGRAYAASKGMLYSTIPCDVSIEPSALFGKMMPTEEAGKFRWQDGPVTQIVREGGVLNISELNFMPARIAASLYPLLDHRRCIVLLQHDGEVVEAHPDLLVIADMNPKYRGTTDLNLALANRFPIKINWGYDKSVEKSLVKSPALLEMVEKIRSQPAEIRTPVSTNMLMEFETLAQQFGSEWAVANFVECFADGERDAIKRIVDMFSREIEKSVKRIKEGKPVDEEEDLDDSSWHYEEEEEEYVFSQRI